MKKTYYAIKKTNFAVLAAAFLMLCGAAVRIVYYTGVRATAVGPGSAAHMRGATLCCDALY